VGAIGSDRDLVRWLLRVGGARRVRLWNPRVGWGYRHNAYLLKKAEPLVHRFAPVMTLTEALLVQSARSAGSRSVSLASNPIAAFTCPRCAARAAPTVPRR
jgi:hypothetical protein